MTIPPYNSGPIHRDPIDRLNNELSSDLSKQMEAARFNLLSTIHNAIAWRLDQDNEHIRRLGYEAARRAGMFVVHRQISPPFEGAVGVDTLSLRLERQHETDGAREVLGVFMPIDFYLVRNQRYRNVPLIEPNVLYFAESQQYERDGIRHEDLVAWYEVGKRRFAKANMKDGLVYDLHEFTYVDNHAGADQSIELKAGELDAIARGTEPFDPVQSEVINLMVACRNMPAVTQ